MFVVESLLAWVILFFPDTLSSIYEPFYYKEWLMWENLTLYQVISFIFKSRQLGQKVDNDEDDDEGLMGKSYFDLKFKWTT